MHASMREPHGVLQHHVTMFVDHFHCMTPLIRGSEMTGATAFNTILIP